MSRLDSQAARDYDRMTEVMESVIRRIGGKADQAETVDNVVVEIDTDGGGLTTNNNGQATEIVGRLELPAGQANSGFDSWVIGGRVYKQRGEATGSDGGSQTITIVHRIHRTAAEPRTRNR
jgi:hypothetical protein